MNLGCLSVCKLVFDLTLNLYFAKKIHGFSDLIRIVSILLFLFFCGCCLLPCLRFSLVNVTPVFPVIHQIREIYNVRRQTPTLRTLNSVLCRIHIQHLGKDMQNFNFAVYLCVANDKSFVSFFQFLKLCLFYGFATFLAYILELLKIFYHIAIVQDFSDIDV